MSALTRAAVGSRELGGRYVIVDAIDDNAESFYHHHGFEAVPGQQHRLLIPTKVLQSLLR